jgi:hypothetical protein
MSDSKTISQEQIGQELKELELLCSTFTKVSPTLKKILEERGYEYKCLGTGEQSYSYSLMIDVWTLDNSYLKGKYIGVGTCNVGGGKGCYYHAMVKQVVKGVNKMNVKFNGLEPDLKTMVALKVNNEVSDNVFMTVKRAKSDINGNRRYQVMLFVNGVYRKELLTWYCKKTTDNGAIIQAGGLTELEGKINLMLEKIDISEFN